MVHTISCRSGRIALMKNLRARLGRSALLAGARVVSKVATLVGGRAIGYPFRALALFVAASIAELAFTVVVRSHEVRQSMGTVTAFVISERASYAASMVSIVSVLLTATVYFRRRFGWSWSPFSWQNVREGTVGGSRSFSQDFCRPRAIGWILCSSKGSPPPTARTSRNSGRLCGGPQCSWVWWEAQSARW